MDQTAQIKNKIDIVDLIASYIPLKKMGRNFKAPCPFHGEKTPSFVVSPERQIWHCFGCQKGGDVFTFLMEYEHMEFPEALRFLAQKTGVQLIQQHVDSGISSKKEMIYTLNHLASEFYHYLLTQHAVGQKARDYLLNERHIKPQTMKTYMLGFAPRNGNVLSNYLLKKKQYTREEIIDAGLGSIRGSLTIDFFQGRLMFPLYDHRNNIIGFSGRILTDEDTAKYINTRETLVYHKGQVFFGLNSAKETIKKEERAIVMEGEFDVIASFQEGITNAVAVKGTALTDEQVRLIARFAKKVSLCFDQDRAGKEATKRSLQSLEKNGVTTTVIVVPNGKDPAEAIQSDPIAFKNAVKHDIGIYDYLLQQAIKIHTIHTIDGKKKITDELLPIIQHIENEVVKEHYLTLLGKELTTSQQALAKEMERLSKREIIKTDVFLPKTKKPREELLEEYVLSLLVQHPNPKSIVHKIEQMLSVYQYVYPAYQKLSDKLRSYVSLHENFQPDVFIQSLPQELLPAFDTCFLLPLPTFADDNQRDKEIEKVIASLSQISIHQQVKQIGQAIKQKEKEGNLEEIGKLQQTLTQLVELLPKIT